MTLAKWLRSAILTMRLRQAFFSASSAKSRPIFLRNLKQSVNVLAALYIGVGGPCRAPESRATQSPGG